MEVITQVAEGAGVLESLCVARWFGMCVSMHTKCCCFWHLQTQISESHFVAVSCSAENLPKRDLVWHSYAPSANRRGVGSAGSLARVTPVWKNRGLVTALHTTSSNGMQLADIVGRAAVAQLTQM